MIGIKSPMIGMNSSKLRPRQGVHWWTARGMKDWSMSKDLASSTGGAVASIAEMVDEVGLYSCSAVSARGSASS